MNLVGSVEGKNAIIIDDMIDTAGTLCEAAKTLKQFGALSVSSFATHGLFSGNAFKNISNSVLENIVVTNTTPKKPGEESIDKITRLSVGNVDSFNYNIMKELLQNSKTLLRIINNFLKKLSYSKIILTFVSFITQLQFSQRQSTESKRNNLLQISSISRLLIRNHNDIRNKECFQQREQIIKTN